MMKRSALRRAIGSALLAIVLLGLPASASPGEPSAAQNGGRHICVAEDGRVVRQAGTATCFAAAGSSARAVGAGSHAAAGNGGKASVVGVGSLAQAENGSVATVVGDRSSAQAVDRSVARTIGNDSVSIAVIDSVARVLGNGGDAQAGADSTATAFGACTVTASLGETQSCNGR